MNLTEEARRLLTCEELRGRVPEEVADFLRRVAGLELGTDFHAFTSAVVNDPHHGGGNSWQWRREADNASAAKVRTVSRASAPEVTDAMAERAAIAVAEDWQREQSNVVLWPDLPEGGRELARAQVRVVLAALQEQRHD